MWMCVCVCVYDILYIYIIYIYYIYIILYMYYYVYACMYRNHPSRTGHTSRAVVRASQAAKDVSHVTLRSSPGTSALSHI